MLIANLLVSPAEWFKYKHYKFRTGNNKTPPTKTLIHLKPTCETTLFIIQTKLISNDRNYNSELDYFKAYVDCNQKVCI